VGPHTKNERVKKQILTLLFLPVCQKFAICGKLANKNPNLHRQGKLK